jgi:hypothetical protein
MLKVSSSIPSFTHFQVQKLAAHILRLQDAATKQEVPLVVDKIGPAWKGLDAEFIWMAAVLEDFLVVHVLRNREKSLILDDGT